MRSLVLCYLRTGTTKEVAAALAESLGAELAELHCDRYRPGPLGYVRAAYDSLRRRLAPVSVPPAVGLSAPPVARLALTSKEIASPSTAERLHAFAAELTDLVGKR